MRKLIIFIFLLNGFALIYSQKLSPGRYWIPFTDKNGNGYSIHSPEKFLSERAIQRRLRQKIPLKTEDLPVTKAYVDSLRKLGLKLSGTSKWFNAAIVETNDTLLLGSLKKISFIKDFDYSIPLKGLTQNATFVPENNKSPDMFFNNLTNYGFAEKQIDLINGKALHTLGYKGKDIIIAVIDGGFYNVDSYKAFDSLWINKQILAWYDFANPGNLNFFKEHYHGTSVLSTMSANIPGEIIGTAPEASYLLLRSEVISSEYRVEEAWWVLAAEFADSSGADIINSSLGYSTFDDAAMNYTINDLNGKTSLVTIAAEKAFSKGIVVVASAGNEGNKSWKKITSPADGKNILAVGAIDTFRNLAAFSSIGPSADQRIKPDIAAVGYKTTISLFSGITGSGNGTSFSSPQIAGMIACLWQAIPEKTNLEIINGVRRSSSQYYYPDNKLGYGIPDFLLALEQLKSSPQETSSNGLMVIPNPTQGIFEIRLINPDEEVTIIYIYDAIGRNVAVIKNPNVFSGYVRISELSNLQPGIYYIKLRTAKKDYQAKLIKQ